MDKQQQYIQDILKKHKTTQPGSDIASAYAPSNIALCKYWGKRDTELNLPITPSLSVSLADKGATTVLKVIEAEQDVVLLDDLLVPPETVFASRISRFLNLFRPKGLAFEVSTHSTVPVSAGLASSAAGFAALTEALSLLFDWHLDARELSLIARLGSGSACRSLWHGFVEWHRGEREDGMDSHGELLETKWPELCIGLVVCSEAVKTVSSRDGMLRTQATSDFYDAWPRRVESDLAIIKQAIEEKDFELLAETAEQNALAMHATMLTAIPSIMYWQPATVEAMHKVWNLRKEGMQVYFTEDAGPNLKLLFLAEDAAEISAAFPGINIVSPFTVNQES